MWGRWHFVRSLCILRYLHKYECGINAENSVSRTSLQLGDVTWEREVSWPLDPGHNITEADAFSYFANIGARRKWCGSLDGADDSECIGISFQRCSDSKMLYALLYTLGNFMCLSDNACAQNLLYSNLSMNMDHSPFTKKHRNILSNICNAVRVQYKNDTDNYWL